MFTTLVASSGQRARNGKSTTISLLVHGALIATAVAVTTTTRTVVAAEPPENIIYTAPVPLDKPVQSHTSAPAQQSAPLQSTRFVDIVVPISIRTTIPEVNVATPATPDDAQFLIGHHVGGRTGSEETTGLPMGGVNGVIDADRADRAPFVLGNAPAPRYPAILRESGTAGQVVARFIVDTLGRAEPGSVAIVEASHPLFGEAVKTALPTYRFSPGEVGGRKVRTLVQMPFTFAIR